MINLYPYQKKLVSAIRASMSGGNTRVICQSPTGSGKTIIFTFIISEMLKRGKRALIITDRIELLTETGGTLAEFGIKPFEILAGQKFEDISGNVYIAMSQTLRRRIGIWKRFFTMFDVIIVDEAHKQEFDVYRPVFPSTTYVLGFTATPVRSGKMAQLGEYFTDLITGPQVPELIRDGYLVRDKYFGVHMVDMSGVKISSLGDYQENEMYKRYDKRQIYSGAVENWKLHTPETITLGFAVNIIHTVKMCEAFNCAGIPAKFITSELARPEPGTTPASLVRYNEKLAEYNQWRAGYELYSGERSRVISDWKAGKFKVLFNAGILTTGFNYKEIETILVCRATVSVPLWLQILGRGSRIFPGKTHFNILDFGDNGSRLGYYNQQRGWDLWHKKSKGGGAAPVKECKGKEDKNTRKGCGALIFTSQMICPFCGYIFQSDKAEKIAELVQIDYQVLPERTGYSELDRIAESKGYKHGWVIAQIIAKDGREGLKQYAKEKGYKQGWLWNTEKRYARLLEN